MKEELLVSQVEYKMRVIGKGGEVYNYPVGVVVNVEISINHIRAKKESEYWEIQIYSEDEEKETLVFRETMRLINLIKYEEYFGSGRLFDESHLSSFKGDTVEQLISHVGGLEKGLTLDREGLKAILNGENDKYGVIGIKPSDTLWEDFNNLVSEGIVEAQTQEPAGLPDEELRSKTFIYLEIEGRRRRPKQPLHLEVDYLEGITLEELLGDDWYGASLEYGVDGKRYALGSLDLRANEINGVSILNEGLSKESRMFIKNLDTLKLVNNLDEELKHMLLQEAVAN